MAGHILDWSTTAADNDDADGDINWLEGQKPSTVNNSARQTMARIKEFLEDIGKPCAATLSTLAWTCTPSSGNAPSAWTDGYMFSILPNSDNAAGANTINAASLGAKPFRIESGVNMTAGQVQANRVVLCMYDSENDEVLGISGSVADQLGFVDISGTPAANDFARFTDADTIEGREYSEVLTDLSLSTSDTPQFTGIEIGHATDTTLTRASAGVAAIEGNNLYTTADDATVANYQDNTADKLLTTDIVWAAMAEQTLTDGANISWDMDAGIDFTVTLGGNRTLDNATNTQIGKKGRIRVVQDSTGSRTLSFGTSYEFAGGTAVTLTTTGDAEDILFYDCISATRILITSLLDVS